MASTEIDFNSENVLVQISSLPLNQITHSNVKAIANLVFGGLIKSDDLMIHNDDWDLIIRIKVKLDFTTPLPKGFHNCCQAKKDWILFYYERLPHFFHLYDFLDHQKSYCKWVKTHKEREKHLSLKD